MSPPGGSIANCKRHSYCFKLKHLFLSRFQKWFILTIYRFWVKLVQYFRTMFDLIWVADGWSLSVNSLDTAVSHLIFQYVEILQCTVILISSVSSCSGERHFDIIYERNKSKVRSFGCLCQFCTSWNIYNEVTALITLVLKSKLYSRFNRWSARNVAQSCTI